MRPPDRSTVGPEPGSAGGSRFNLAGLDAEPLRRKRGPLRVQPWTSRHSASPATGRRLDLGARRFEPEGRKRGPLRLDASTFRVRVSTSQLGAWTSTGPRFVLAGSNRGPCEVQRLRCAQKRTRWTDHARPVPARCTPGADYHGWHIGSFRGLVITRVSPGAPQRIG